MQLVKVKNGVYVNDDRSYRLYILRIDQTSNLCVLVKVPLQWQKYRFLLQVIISTARTATESLLSYTNCSWFTSFVSLQHECGNPDAVSRLNACSIHAGSKSSSHLSPVASTTRSHFANLLVWKLSHWVSSCFYGSTNWTPCIADKAMSSEPRTRNDCKGSQHCIGTCTVTAAIINIYIGVVEHVNISDSSSFAEFSTKPASSVFVWCDER